MASNSWPRAARKLLLPLSLLVLLAVTSASAARPMVQTSSSTAATAVTAGSALGTPRRVEQEVMSWEGVTVDTVASGNLGVVEGWEDSEVAKILVIIFVNEGYNVMVIKSEHSVYDGEPFSATVQVAHSWGDSYFRVYFLKGPFRVVNWGESTPETWDYGGNYWFGSGQLAVYFT